MYIYTNTYIINPPITTTHSSAHTLLSAHPPPCYQPTHANSRAINDPPATHPCSTSAMFRFLRISPRAFAPLLPDVRIVSAVALRQSIHAFHRMHATHACSTSAMFRLLRISPRAVAPLLHAVHIVSAVAPRRPHC